MICHGTVNDKSMIFIYELDDNLTWFKNNKKKEFEKKITAIK